ncbi:ankyrin [Neocallimastix lanati (nom. inval.)]|jgi:ankyrin repeat protein|uniref:Ankyrin n=1 Tax=Neocallimastix californiae TaxID=1754190 RepID=A0A1Y2CIH4_9FUNG|nr:ankyrin [Neocallimastix sp. JGI-2020a]ORY46707.1 ankyrin [Neocallimastix californiae]|eukprot:ORY46707.1 ankyrin [Neocallimastix californiae]
MSQEELELKILNYIKDNNEECINYINNNKKFIQEYYNEYDNSLAVKKFVDKLNDVVMDLTRFKLMDKVLNHPAFKDIYKEFRESEILIRACQNAKNKKLVEWLFTKNIDLYIQDNEGKTALMHAAEHYQMLFAVEKLIEGSGDHIHMTDNNGNTALFYGNRDALIRMLKAKFDLNHINNDNENIFLYCCKADKYKSFDLILDLDINFNLVNNVGKTGAMYLVEHNRFLQLRDLIAQKQIDVNYKNKFGDTLVSVFINNYYRSYSNYMGNFVTEVNYLQYKNAAFTLQELVKAGCNFNDIIDEDGNTPIIFFLLTEDYVSANYILSNCDNIDVSVQNKFDNSASLLSEFINKNVFDRLQYHKKRNKDRFSYDSLINLIRNNKTFDSSYLNGNNISMNKQYRYSPSSNTTVIQQWFLEFLYPNIGAEYYYVSISKKTSV